MYVLLCSMLQAADERLVGQKAQDAIYYQAPSSTKLLVEKVGVGRLLVDGLGRRHRMISIKSGYPRLFCL